MSSTEASSVGEMPALLKSTSMRPNALARARVHVDDLLLVGDVDLEREVARRAGEQVDADDGRALAREPLGGGRADAAARAGDHADLAREPHEVAKKIVLTSV